MPDPSPDATPRAPRPPARTVRLGASDLTVLPLAIGTWSWGDRGEPGGWGVGESTGEAGLGDAFQAAVARGPVLFDAAERYGGGEAERLLGRLVRASPRPALVATKFSPGRWQLRRRDLLRALRGSLARLGLPRVDLYQVHWPTRFCPVGARMAAMADAVGEGLVRAVGVSNYGLEQVLRAHHALGRLGLPLATVQVELSLLAQGPERSGLLRACRERGITVLAYSPLASGVLSGAYRPGRPPPGWRGARWDDAALARLTPLLTLLGEVGRRHGDRPPAQVALAWVRAKGAVPIAGARSRRQAEENLGALDWDLAPDEVAALDRAADGL